MASKAIDISTVPAEPGPGSTSRPPTAGTRDGSLTARAWADQAQGLEDAILSHPAAVTELPLFHYFANCVYARRLDIPPDTLLTGRVHRADCINIVLGHCEVASAEGNVELEGLSIFSSPGGTKRAIRTFSATIWITVHANPSDERDGERMADLLTVPRFEDLEASANRSDSD